MRNKCLHHIQRLLPFSAQNTPSLLLNLDFLQLSCCQPSSVSHSAAHRVYFCPQSYPGTRVLVLIPKHKDIDLNCIETVLTSDLKHGSGATD